MGVQVLIFDFLCGCFDMIMVEVMDWLLCDQEDIVGIFKCMIYVDVKMFILFEGEIIYLYVGLKGMMNVLFLKDLVDKICCGLCGCVEDGKFGGGFCYGYDVVKKFDDCGEVIWGDWMINEIEVGIV